MIERLIILSGKEKRIERKHFPVDMMAGSYQEAHVTEAGKDSPKLQDNLNSLARKIIEDELNLALWNKTTVARKLGMSRASLNNKIAQFNIQPDSSQ